MKSIKILQHTSGAPYLSKVVTCADNTGTTTLRNFTLCAELPSFGDLDDVVLDSPSDGDFLVVNTNEFVNDPVFADIALNDLLDVTLSLPSSDQIGSRLVYDGSEWVDVRAVQKVSGNSITVPLDFGTRNVLVQSSNAVEIILPQPNSGLVLTGEILHIYKDQASTNISVRTTGTQSDFTNTNGDAVTSLIVNPMRKFLKLILAKTTNGAGAYVQIME